MVEEQRLIYYENMHWIGVEANLPGMRRGKEPTSSIKQPLDSLQHVNFYDQHETLLTAFQSTSFS